MSWLDSTGARRRTRDRPSRHRPEAWWALALPLLLFLALPLLALLFYSPPAELRVNLARPEVRQAIGLSLRTSAWATLAAVLLGLPVAYLLARREFRGRLLLDNLIDLPIVLPPAVAGLALLLVFGRRGWLGAPLDDLGVRVTFTQVAVVIAQTFIAVSLFIRAATIGFAAVEPELEDAAAIDGAGPGQVFWRISLPLARRGVLSGVALAWARALGEFGATTFLTRSGRETLPIAIDRLLSRAGQIPRAQAFALATILLVVTGAIAAFADRTINREGGVRDA